MLSRQRYISCALSKLFTGPQRLPVVLQNNDASPSAAIFSCSTPSQCGQRMSFGVKKWFTHSDTKITPSCTFRLSTDLPRESELYYKGCESRLQPGHEQECVRACFRFRRWRAALQKIPALSQTERMGHPQKLIQSQIQKEQRQIAQLKLPLQTQILSLK